MRMWPVCWSHTFEGHDGVHGGQCLWTLSKRWASIALGTTASQPVRDFEQPIANNVFLLSVVFFFLSLYSPCCGL